MRWEVDVPFNRAPGPRPCTRESLLGAVGCRRTQRVGQPPLDTNRERESQLTPYDRRSAHRHGSSSNRELLQETDGDAVAREPT